jgi:hypothetical protein
MQEQALRDVAVIVLDFVVQQAKACIQGCQVILDWSNLCRQCGFEGGFEKMFKVSILCLNYCSPPLILCFKCSSDLGWDRGNLGGG